MSDVAVVLVDDHNLVRAGIRALLNGLSGVNVIGEADNGATALELVRRQTPDVLISDISMRGMSGLELASAMQESFPKVRVIILSMHVDEDYVQGALRAGAAAYLIKDAADAELEIALRAVMRGETYVSPGVSRQIIDGYMQNSVNTQDLLTPRQREILKLIAEGLVAKEIAHRLGISVKTVEAHRSQLMERLKIRDLAGLVKYAIKNDIARLK